MQGPHAIVDAATDVVTDAVTDTVTNVGMAIEEAAASTVPSQHIAANMKAGGGSAEDLAGTPYESVLLALLEGLRCVAFSNGGHYKPNSAVQLSGGVWLGVSAWGYLLWGECAWWYLPVGTYLGYLHCPN